MAKEFEAKFININKDRIVKKLQAIGARKVTEECLLKRCMYELPIPRAGTWARVRDEVDKITMTYKCVKSASADGIDEIELTVDSFENAREFLKSIGLIEKAYQESKRIRYVLGTAEFDINTWPGLNPLIEIEDESEEKVRERVKDLGFDWKDAMFGGIAAVYEKTFNITEDWINSKCQKLSFDNIPFEISGKNLRSSER